MKNLILKLKEDFKLSIIEKQQYIYKLILTTQICTSIWAIIGDRPWSPLCAPIFVAKF